MSSHNLDGHARKGKILWDQVGEWSQHGYPELMRISTSRGAQPFLEYPLSGPWDRTYGFDLTQYVGILGSAITGIIGL